MKKAILIIILGLLWCNTTNALEEDKKINKLLQNYFGDRKLNTIEGVWGYRRDNEKEPRIYVIFQSDDYLYTEIVIWHPIRKFEDQISTKVIKKINEVSYEVKRTWSNKDTIMERDGIITIINKFKLKFESSEHCYSNEEKCLKADTIYKKRIWPPRDYTDQIDLTEEQSNKLKELLD